MYARKQNDKTAAAAALAGQSRALNQTGPFLHACGFSWVSSAMDRIVQTGIL